jgi:hypothetical protein
MCPARPPCPSPRPRPSPPPKQSARWPRLDVAVHHAGLVAGVHHAQHLVRDQRHRALRQVAHVLWRGGGGRGDGRGGARLGRRGFVSRKKRSPFARGARAHTRVRACAQMPRLGAQTHLHLHTCTHTHTHTHTHTPARPPARTHTHSPTTLTHQSPARTRSVESTLAQHAPRTRPPCRNPHPHPLPPHPPPTSLSCSRSPPAHSSVTICTSSPSSYTPSRRTALGDDWRGGSGRGRLGSRRCRWAARAGRRGGPHQGPIAT